MKALEQYVYDAIYFFTIWEFLFWFLLGVKGLTLLKSKGSILFAIVKLLHPRREVDHVQRARTKTYVRESGSSWVGDDSKMT